MSSIARARSPSPAPELALGRVAAPEGEHHRQRDLALAEIVADGLAEIGLPGGIIQHVVDQLEGDAEIEAVAPVLPRITSR
jgi:hypothetical protein